MGGAISAGGLITGIDSGNLIRQLLQLERQPITRIQDRITTLRGQQTSLRELRTNLQTLRNRAQDFRLSSIFTQFQARAVDEDVATATISGANPSTGSYSVNVLTMASATVATSSARLGASMTPASTLAASGMATAVTSGTFSVNGVQFTVDPATDSLNDIIADINASAAGVTATYNAVDDTVSLANTAPANTAIINLGAATDTSNFLDATKVSNATQSTNGFGSTQLSSTGNLGAVNPNSLLNAINFGGGAVSAGSFFINGISISVDPTTETLDDIVTKINNSDAGATAIYDSATDRLRFVSDTEGSRTINFTAGTSNFLTSTSLAAATQDAGDDTTFTINGGPVQTRNTNDVTDAIGGVTLSFVDTGTTVVNVTTDEDAVLEDVRAFVDAFNSSVAMLREVTANEGRLRNDGGLRSIESALRSLIFQQVSGQGSLQSLVDIGISTGDDFNSTQVPQLQLDEDTFLEALRNDRENISGIFANGGETGVGDLIFNFLDELTGFNGPLDARSRASGSIDGQIQGLNDRIDRIEMRVAQKERRLRAQFSRLEQVSAGFQGQSQALGALQSSFRRF